MKDKLVSFIFELLLFVVFLLCSLFIVVIGSRVLDNTQKRSKVDFYDTLSLQYVSNKVHQKDKEDLIGLAEIEGQTVLEFRNKESDYVTWIYYLDGALTELLTDPSDGLGLKDGNKVMECSEVKFSEDKQAGLLSVCSGDKNLTIHLNSNRVYEIVEEKE